MELTQTQQIDPTQEITAYRSAPRSSTSRSFSNAPEIVKNILRSNASLPSSSLGQMNLTQSPMSGMQIETQMLMNMMLGVETGDAEMLGLSSFLYPFQAVIRY